MKVNIFEYSRYAGGSLGPLFPYLDAGSIVPAVTLVFGKPNGRYGSFIHANTQDEVVMIFGSHGVPGRQGTGIVRVGNKTHPVGRFFEDDPRGPDPNDLERFALLTVTQRQAEDGQAQKESIWFLCESCKKEMLRADFDATPPPRGKAAETLGAYPLFETLSRTDEATRLFNANLTCKRCGHENPPFPAHRWRMQDYVDQHRAVRMARGALDATAELFAGGKPAQ
jgi:hypothetical protein